MADEATVSLPAWESETPPPPLIAQPEAKSAALTFSDVAGHTAPEDVNVAYRWSKLYERDIEYEPFFNWIGRRSNPERTDFHDILESVPLQWGPEDLPPPLRRYFLRRFAK
jgi:hypothetical protein